MTNRIRLVGRPTDDPESVEGKPYVSIILCDGTVVYNAYEDSIGKYDTYARKRATILLWRRLL